MGLRLASGLGILLLVAPVVTAAMVQPSPRGWGTHEAFGLRPCSFQRITGLRCPTCGMTTSWAHLARGNVRGALAANVSGTLLWAIDVIGIGYLAVVLWRGRTGLSVRRATLLGWFAVAIGLGIFVEWAIRLLAGAKHL